jgi:DNA-binding response OmpR family regulator
VSTPSLLVIDDSPTVRKLVELSFANKPWKLFYAASGGQGVRLAEELKPDVIFLDFVLPDMTGADVCASISSRTATHSRVVLMTAKEERVRSKFSSFPMVVDYVTKPFTPEMLLAKANRALIHDATSATSQRSNPSSDWAQDRPSSARSAQAAQADGYTSLPAPMDLLDLLDVLQARRASGDLLLHGNAGQVSARFDQGRLLSATSGGVPKLPDGPTRAASPRLDATRPGPPTASATQALLLPLIADPELRVAFKTTDSDPQASSFAAVPLRRLRLAWLRDQPQSTVAAAGGCFERAAGFSQRIAGLDLSSEERSVLAATAEPMPLGKIAESLGLPTAAASAIVRRLTMVDLLRHAPAAPNEGRRRVVVVEPRSPTRLAFDGLFAQSFPEVEIVMCSTVAEAESTLRLKTASLIVVNAQDCDAAIRLVSQRATPSGSLASAFVAILDELGDPSTTRLAMAGFDAVLYSPVHFDELAPFIADHPTRHHI